MNYSEEVLRVLEESKYQKNEIGCSYTEVFYLKINPKNNFESLKSDLNILNFLNSNSELKIPEIYDYLEDENYEYMIMSKISGDASYLNNIDIKKRLGILAESLRSIHSVKIENIIFLKDISVDLKKIEYMIKNDLVETDDFEEENIGKTPTEIYNEIIRLLPVDEDIVFTHGDYCMPNIFIKIF